MILRNKVTQIAIIKIRWWWSRLRGTQHIFATFAERQREKERGTKRKYTKSNEKNRKLIMFYFPSVVFLCWVPTWELFFRIIPRRFQNEKPNATMSSDTALMRMMIIMMMMMMNQLLFVLRLGFGILLYANRETDRQIDRQAGRQTDKQTESHWGKFVKGLSKICIEEKEKKNLL